MRLFWKYRPSPAFGVAFVALLVALGGVAYAAIPSTGGTITACVKGEGQVRIIDAEAGESCGNQESTLRWQDGSQVGDADTLDGKDSTEFLGASAKAADSDLLDGKDSTEFLGASAKAADSDLLDGKDSTEFLGANAKAADSDLLDGFDSIDLREACPAGMVESNELCIGPHVAGSWGDGYYACLNAGQRLPDSGEAGLVTSYVASLPNAASEDFWTSDTTGQETAMMGEFIIPAFFDLLDRPVTDTPGYRCVATPGQPETGPAMAGARRAVTELRPRG
jgi:hypothetical protein